MGLAINGKIIQSSGLTYINSDSDNNLVDTGYINVDGTPSPTLTTFLSIFDLVAPGTYLTDLATLQQFHGFSGFMNGYYNIPAEVPVLIHVPENNLVKYKDKNALTLLAYFCYLISYNKLDDKNKNNDTLGKIYSKLTNATMLSTGLIQPPVNELVNFTFSVSGGKPMSATALFNDSVDNIVDNVYYKGRQIEFYQYAGTDINNISNRIIIYLGGGYGFSVIPDYALKNKYDHYMYMKLSDPDKDGVIAVYDRSNYHIQIDKGLTNTKGMSLYNSNNHGYSYPSFFSPNTSDGTTTYDDYTLAFSTNVEAEDTSTGFKFMDVSLATDAPYNPHLFTSICLNNHECSWFKNYNHNLLTLPKQFDFNYLSVLVGYAQNPMSFNADFGVISFLPQGKYLINSLSIKDDVSNSPVVPADIDYVELKVSANSVLEQKIYLGYYQALGYQMYYRRGKAYNSGNGTYTDWHNSNIIYGL